jgi:hypothetical protein
VAHRREHDQSRHGAVEVVMLQNILMGLFALTLLANAIALVRHYMVMRMLMIALNGFVEQQRMLNEYLEAEGVKTPLSPEK